MGNSIVQILLAALILLSGSALGSVDFCKNNLYENVGGKKYVHFSKENSDREFAVVDSFKSLHCCSQGYRSIEWFKNGIPYPWSTDVSTLIISPESGNQTIYSQVISEMDSGKYWCVVRNDTDSIRHDVILKVSGPSELEEPPKATYTPKDQRLKLGANARFYCEAFVGNISLPDAKSEINWRKVNSYSPIPTKGRVRQEVVSRDGNQILGSYLFIYELKKEDYGNYKCTVSNTGDQFLEMNVNLFEEDKHIRHGCTRYPSRGVVITATVLIACITISTVFIVYCKSYCNLMCKAVCRRVFSKNNEEYDILVIHHTNDSEFAMSKLIFTLQNSYHYKCLIQLATFDKIVTRCKEVREKSENSKRLIIVLSPAMVDNEWTCQKLNALLTDVINIHTRVIIVLLKPLPLNDEREDVEALQELLKRAYCVEYEVADVQKFWDLLALGLPPCNVTPDNREIFDLV